MHIWGDVEWDVLPQIPVVDSTSCVMDYLLSPGDHLRTIFGESPGDFIKIFLYTTEDEY